MGSSSRQHEEPHSAWLKIRGGKNIGSSTRKPGERAVRRSTACAASGTQATTATPSPSIATMSRQQTGAKPWVATVLWEQRQGEGHDNEERLRILCTSLEEIRAGQPDDGVILFPGGWFQGGEQEPRHLYSWAESRVCPVIKRIGQNTAVCVGIDGRGYLDQVGLALSGKGITALGRKFCPTVGECQEGVTAAADHLCQEDGVSRLFTLNGQRFYVAVCNDVFGISRCGLEKPGVDAVLALVHQFWPKGAGMSGDVDFARKGFGGASRQWGCPVYGAVVFNDRPVPARWPSGLLWDKGSASVKTWKYADNPLRPIPVPVSVPGVSASLYHLP